MEVQSTKPVLQNIPVTAKQPEYMNIIVIVLMKTTTEKNFTLTKTAL